MTWSGNYRDDRVDYNNIVTGSFPDRTFGYVIPLNFAIGVAEVTRDGGVTWVADTSLKGIVKGDLADVCFTDSLNGWVADVIIPHDSGEVRHNRMYATTDGGRSWHTELYDTVVLANRLQFLNRDLGYASGPGGLLKFERRSGRVDQQDRGAHGWKVRPNPATDLLEILPPSDVAVTAIRLVDAEGRVVYQRRPESAEGERILCDLSTLPSGYYLCRIESLTAVYSTGMILIR